VRKTVIKQIVGGNFIVLDSTDPILSEVEPAVDRVRQNKHLKIVLAEPESAFESEGVIRITIERIKQSAK